MRVCSLFIFVSLLVAVLPYDCSDPVGDGRCCAETLAFGGSCSYDPVTGRTTYLSGEGGTCSSNNDCNTSLTCTAGRCNCYPPSQYYHYSDFTCKTKLNYGGQCSRSTQCKDTLTCVNRVCGCTDAQFFDSTCKSKSNYGGQCSSSTPCMDTLTCVNGVCGCTDTQFYDSTCKAKSSNGGQCSSSSVNGVCGCTDTQFFDSTCKAKSNYGGQCSSSTQCKDTLTCVNGVCGCTDTQFFDSTCKAKSGYTEECNLAISNVCSDTDNFCIQDTTGKHRCLCDVSSYSRSGDCHPLSELRITDFHVDKIDPTQVRFTWSANDYRQNVNYKVKWTSDVDPVDKGEKSANTDGVLVSNLTPGREYKFVITSTLSANIYYAEKLTTVERTVDMLPAQPGPVDQEASQLLDSPPYNLTFQPSEGDVAKYKITLTVDGNSTFRDVIEVVEPRVENLDLLPGRVYTYAIIAYNEIGEITEPSLGSFSTGPSMEDNNDDGDKINVLVVAVAAAGAALALVAVIVVIIVVVMCKRRKANNNKPSKENIEVPQKNTETIYMSYASNGYLEPNDKQYKENVYNQAYEEGYRNVSSHADEDEDKAQYDN